VVIGWVFPRAPLQSAGDVINPKAAADHSGVKLLPDVPYGIGGTKSK